jgi:alpha 1,2-mannosyltransferase
MIRVPDIATCVDSIPEWAIPHQTRYKCCSRTVQFFFRHELVEKYRWYWRIEYVHFSVTSKRSPTLNYVPRPDVHFHCNINFDPFLFMEENNKIYCKYSDNSLITFWTYLTRSIYYHNVRIRTNDTDSLGSCTTFVYSLPFQCNQRTDNDCKSEFMKENPQYVADGNAMNFLSDNGGSKYNLCHCKLYFFVASLTLISDQSGVISR